MALSLPREGALWTINPSRLALFGLGSLIMGSLIQYNLQAGWTHLEQKPWDAHGDISIYLWGKVAEEVGRKRRNNKEEKEGWLRWQQHVKDPNQGGRWECESQLQGKCCSRTCLHDPAWSTGLGLHSFMWSVSYILSPASSWAKHSFKITPPDFSWFQLQMHILYFQSQSFLHFTRIWGGVPSRTNCFSSHLKAGTH